MRYRIAFRPLVGTVFYLRKQTPAPAKRHLFSFLTSPVPEITQQQNYPLLWADP